MSQTQHPVRKFRADIEGLRGVAVGLVVLYHAGFSGLPGGYVGVDVFFVISGFLITGLLIEELRKRSTISLRNFYARRVRRLLPAGILVLIVTLIVAKIIVAPLYMANLSDDAKATALYASNMRFAVTSTEYLRQGDAPSALLHYWSLAVEEQFYFVWPLLLLISYKILKSIPRVAIVIGVVGVASLVMCVKISYESQPWAFFLLPTRAWELAAGAGIAFGAARFQRLKPGVAAVLGWAGLLLVLLAAVTLGDGTIFPGWAALLPVVGTAALIAGGTTPSPLGPQRFLTVPPLVATGRISYSLYLWHWPVLLLPALAVGETLSPWARAGLVVVSVILATLSFRFVEKPFRTRPSLVASPRRSFAMAGSLTTIALGLAFVVSVQPSLSAGKVAPQTKKKITAWDLADAPVPEFVPSNLKPPLAKAKADLPILYADGCHVRFEDVTSPDCVYGDEDGEKTMVLYGDSRAAQWFPALEKIATKMGWRLVTFTKSACPAIDVPITLLGAKSEYDACYEWRRDSLARIADEDPDLIVISNWRTYGVDTPEWGAGLERTLFQMPPGHPVVVLSESPRSPSDGPVCLSGHLKDPATCATPRNKAIDYESVAEERRATKAGGGHYVDTTRWICPHDPCQLIAYNYLIMRDDAHITSTFAEFLTPRLRAALKPFLTKAAA